MSHQAISTESLQHAGRTFPPSPAVINHAHLNAAQYDALYARSLREPEKFWLEQAKTLEWFKAPTVARKFTLGHRPRVKIEHLV
jgi:acetyl-CoA synthetase